MLVVSPGSRRRRLILALASLVASTCSRQHGGAAQGPDPALRERVVQRHAGLAHESYRAAADGARRLQAAIESLVAAPTPAALQAAREAWRAARVPYTRSEAFRFYGGPIDALEPAINAWPVDESYIDYVVGAPSAGIINDEAAPPITAAVLRALNEREGEKNISTGFHAIEFLLWGQDLSTDGPGARPLADFLLGTRAAQRRRTYLKEAAALLARDLEAVADGWRPGRPGNFRASFLKRPPDEAVGLILKGVGTFSGPELTGERLTVAYETKDQENEHSCFSDNTRDDVVGDLEGVERVYRGGPEGPGLAALFGQVEAPLEGRLDAAIAASLAAARRVPAPFDRAIVGRDAEPGRRAVKDLIDALTVQTALLTDAAAALDVRVAFR
jgi:putative iron-regulated protein